MPQSSAFPAELLQRRDDIAGLCRRHDVVRLDVFGSAADGRFAPGESDFDFVVRFAADSKQPPLRQFFGLAHALERALGRPVDLVEESAIRNPFLREEIERTRRPVYGA